MPIEFNAIIGENSYRSRVGTGLVGMTGNSGVRTGWRRPSRRHSEILVGTQRYTFSGGTPNQRVMIKGR